MKTFLAFCGAVILGYVVLNEWLDHYDDDLDALFTREDEHVAHLPHPWSRVIETSVDEVAGRYP